MKIFYAVQATGNGHISRAMQILPFLQQYGQVDIFLSGANATLYADLPIRYRSKGLSLFYSRCGGLNYKRTFTENSLIRANKEARQLPLEDYDIIINDFEFITAKACKLKGLPSVQFGHQASFQSNAVPRPATTNFWGEMVLKKYATATQYIGLHFKRYEPFILPPVIKKQFLESEATNEGHITVYLPAYQQHCIEHHFRKQKDLHFHWFLAGVNSVYRSGNITFMPVSEKEFNHSLLTCHGLITGGGFETPAEALYLGKRLLSIPIRGQYEQVCNGAALSELGVMVLPDAETPHFAADIGRWLSSRPLAYTQEANDIAQSLEMLVRGFASLRHAVA